MKTLYVLYDGRCQICRGARNWLAQQPAYVPLTFLPFQSAEAGCRFPGLAALRPGEDLVVISDDGEFWRGAQAWVLCLWALREYRAWALRLATPVLLPFARRACALISENRYSISHWFAKDSVAELEVRLSAIPEPGDDKSYCRLG